MDGIFAIAMTILVLELKVPELQNPRSSTELWTALNHAWPTLAAYLFSFLMLGVFWVWPPAWPPRSGSWTAGLSL